MNKRQIIALAVILAALTTGVIFKKLERSKEISTQDYVPLSFLSVQESVVKKMVITPSSDREKIELVKSEKGWQVASLLGARADGSKITRFFETLNSAKGELRGSKDTLFKDFGIDEANAFGVDLYAEDEQQPVLALFLGSKRPDGSSIFIREKSAQNVYLTDANLYNRMGLYGDPKEEAPKQSFWAAYELVTADADSITSLRTVQFENGQALVTTNLVREAVSGDESKAKWVFEQPGVPFSPDVGKVKDFFNSMKGWRANSVLNPQEKTLDFEKPAFEMRLGLKDPSQIVLTAAADPSEKGNYYLRLTGESVIFRAAEYTFNSMKIDPSKFFGDNPLSVDSRKTEKLTIRAAKNNYSFSPSEEKRGELTDYLNGVRNLKIKKVFTDPALQKKARSPADYWIELRKTGETVSQVMDCGERLSKEEPDYLCKMRASALPFSISEADFKNLFENLDRLSAPASDAASSGG